MKSRMKIISIMMLIALVFSLVPALALPTGASAATCDWAQFVTDVTVPDGSVFDPSSTFTKTWRLKNIGTCTWTTSYALVFDTGSQMGAPVSIKFPSNVAPGQTVDLTVNMTAPTSAGHYIGYWKFKNASGVLFGIGSTANKSFWVEINVKNLGGNNVAYDFTANAASAIWNNGAGNLSFPGTDGDSAGFGLKKDNPKFETGVVDSQPGLLMAPRNITNGFIQATYPAFAVQSGDRFHTTVGCEFGATSCYVAYRLDYEIDGVTKTYWTFRERYEGLTFVASVDLTPLAGKNVKFTLVINSYGSPIGDRALWGNPVINRKGSVITPTPTVTGTPPTSTPTKTPGPVTVTVPPSSCDKVQFVADVNIPDGTILAPGAQFTKTWRLKNIGSCAWSTSYQLVFFSGEKMGAASSANFPQNVAVGQTVDISINMTAPSAAGSYRGFWMFKNANGALFGIGAQGNKPWWVDIKVSGPTVTPGGATNTPGGATNTPTPTATVGPTVTPLPGTAYDFAANACAASWYSGASTSALPCPGTDGDAKGFVLKVNSPKLETGAIDPRSGLVTFPQNVQDGYIKGIYPPFTVQSGDRFQSTINCAFGSTTCYVVFRLDYQIDNNPAVTFWGPFLERYEGLAYTLEQNGQTGIDLTPLAGKNVKFILTVLAYGTAAGDRAVWVGPRIYRPVGGGPLPTVTPTATQSSTAPTLTPSATATTSSTSGWNKYQNTKYGFEIKYPANSFVSDQTDNGALITIPITPGTNLSGKYVDVSVVEGANPCKMQDPGGPITATENVTINGIQFLKETGDSGGAGNIWDFVTYSTMSNNACVSLTFVLHSINIGNYSTPPPLFDKAAESAVFDQMINTYDWTG